MASERATVGFVGVGNMGWPMAACLVNAGFTVNINDSRREVANNFVQQVGGFAPDSLRELAAGSSDVIVTMLPTSVIVERVLAEGDDNLFAGMKPGTIIIEMSSGVPSVTQRLAEKVAALGGIVDRCAGVRRRAAGEDRATRDHGRWRCGDDRSSDAGAVRDGHLGAADRGGRLGSGDEGAEQPGQHRRLPDRHRGAADRAAVRSRSRP